MNKKILIAENPSAGARDKQSLLSDLKEGLIERGYQVEQESDQKRIQDILAIGDSTNEEKSSVLYVQVVMEQLALWQIVQLLQPR